MTKTIKKEISKLKKLPHPKGRKAAQLSRQIQKIAKREKTKKTHLMKTNVLGEKVMWFKDHLSPDVSVYTPEMTIDIIEKYLGRFDDELEQIKIKHSVGNRKSRQHASREDAINMTITQERDEFSGCGLEIPNLLDSAELKLLKEWNGELRFLVKFKLNRYNRSTLEKMKKQKTKTNQGERISSNNDTSQTEATASKTVSDTKNSVCTSLDEVGSMELD